MALCSSLCCFFLFIFVITGYNIVASEPKVLNMSEFKGLISGDIPVFVKFFAPWCRHCKNLVPTWNELSESFSDTTVIIAKVDCTVETPLCSEEEVKGYPTLKLYINGEQYKYSGQRDLSSLESFVREHTVTSQEGEGEGLAELKSDTFETFIKRNGIQFIKFYAPWCGHCQKLAPVWTTLGNLYKSDSSVGIGKVDCTAHIELCTKYGIQGYPTLLVFGGGIPLDKYSGERTLNGLKNFLQEYTETTGGGEERGKENKKTESDETKENKLTNEEKGEEIIEIDENRNKGHPPEPLLLTEKDFDKVISEGLTFVKFFAPWCGHCKEMAGTWNELAKISHATTRTTIAKVDCTVEKTLCEHYKIDGYPTLLLFSEGNRKMEYSSARDLESLLEFLKQHE